MYREYTGTLSLALDFKVRDRDTYMTIEFENCTIQISESYVGKHIPQITITPNEGYAINRETPLMTTVPPLKKE